MYQSNLKIGDIPLQIKSDIEIPLFEERIFAGFRQNPHQGAVKHWIRQIDPDSFTGPPLEPKEQEKLMCTTAFPRRWLTNPILRSSQIRAAIAGCLKTPELTQISLSWQRAVIRNFNRNEYFFFYPPERKVEFAKPIFNARLRNLLGFSFVKFSSFLIHAAGLVIGDRGALLLAPDEGGKTTAARQMCNESVLSDDHVILGFQENDFFIHGTPFGRMTCGPKRARLKGMFRIEKGSPFEIKPMATNDMLKFIWEEHRLQVSVLPKAVMKSLFNLLYEACHRVPTYQMRLPKGQLDVGALQSALAK